MEELAPGRLGVGWQQACDILGETKVRDGLDPGLDVIAPPTAQYLSRKGPWAGVAATQAG